MLHRARRSLAHAASLAASLAALATLATLAASLSGCLGGVKAFEREKLAHPTMTAAAIDIGLDGHVRAVSEGAAGGLGGGGGGCGCN